MKSINQLFKKSLIALSMTAIIFAACKKSDTGIEPQPTTGIETQSSTARIETQPTTTEEASTELSAMARAFNRMPIIKTGPDQTYTTAVSSITLDGSGSSDPDGSISSYLWTKDYGTGGTITSPTTAKTTVTGLTAGQYRFKLKITDNRGASISDTIHISNGSGGTTPPPANQAPVVNAGSNQTITSPASSVTLSGSATDADGTIASYLWTKSSGTGGTITSPNAASSTVTGLTAGVYVFDLKATDNAGATGNKTVTITVSSATPPPTNNQSPNIKTGPDQTYTTAVSSITLNGSGSNDPDGSISSFLWTKDFGTGGTITSPNSATTTVTGLTAGQYRFKLRITDNSGAAVSDTIHISNGSGGTTPPPPPVNQAPVVNAGSNQTIISPVSSVTLSGSATDADGTIASYLWTKTSGTGGTITSPNAASSTVTGLTAGAYVFNLRATDNAGAMGNKTVTITVSSSTPPPPPVNQAPVVNAGSNQTIISPASSVTLSGSATDADGTIASYLWTKTSGTGGTINSANSASTTVTALTAGSYVFNLRATDNAGAMGNKTVSVTVNAATPPPAAGYTLTFQTGFDAMSDMTYGGNGQYGNGTISTTTYKTGPGSFYSRPANVSSGIRSEVQYGGSEQNNTEGAVEYDVMYEVVVPNNGHSFQWHPNTGGGSASPGLWHMGGKFAMVNWINGGNQEHATNVTIQTQRWYHMRMEYKFASNGYFRLYIDGVLATSWTGQVGDGSGQYMKVGYNGWDGNSTSSRIYYDNLKIYRKS